MAGLAAPGDVTGEAADGQVHPSGEQKGEADDEDHAAEDDEYLAEVGHRLILLSGGCRIATVDDGANAFFALLGAERLIALNFGGFVGQRVVLDHSAEPEGILAPTQVVQPGFVVNAFGYLRKEDEILGAEIQAIAWAAEVEASVGRQFAFGVFS